MSAGLSVADHPRRPATERVHGEQRRDAGGEQDAHHDRAGAGREPGERQEWRGHHEGGGPVARHAACRKRRLAGDLADPAEHERGDRGGRAPAP